MSNFDSVWQHLESRGKKIAVPIHADIPLPPPGRFYLIRNGCFNLYFLPAGKEGPRTYLTQIKEGFLLSLESTEKFSLIAHSCTDTEILDCEWSLVSDPPLEPFTQALNQSLDTLSHMVPDPSGEKQKQELEESASLLNQKLWEKGVSVFSECVSRRLHVYMAETVDRDFEVLKERDLQADKIFTLSLTDMGHVLSQQIDADKNFSKDPLYYIFQKIGQAIHFEFSFPQHFPKEFTDSQKIEAICEVSQIRYRKIQLRKNWWQQDMGPLLAFAKDSPCALLTGDYFLEYKKIGLHDEEKVTHVNAETFSPSAYMFYVPFPPNLTTGGQIIRFLAKYTMNHWKMLLIFSVLGMIAALFPSAATYLLIQYAIAESSLSLTAYLSVGLLFASLGIPLFYFLRNYCQLKIEGIAAHLAQTALWDRLLKLAPPFFRRYSIGNLYWRVMSIDEIRVSLSSANIIAVLNGIFSIFFFLIMLYFAPLLAGFVILLSLISLFVVLICAYWKVKYLKKFNEIQGAIRSLGLQMVFGVSKLRTAGAEKSAFAFWASLFAKSKIWQNKALGMQNLSIATAALFPILTIWAVYTALVFWIGVQGLPLANFLAFNIALSNFIITAYPMGSALIWMVDAIPNWEKTKPILEEVQEEGTDRIRCGPLTGNIRLDEVVFSYHSDSPLVLRGVSLEIHPRDFIGIVGKSGCGKSTIARLLLGFEKPVSGAIYFNGQDLKHLDPRSVRKQIGSALQGDRIGGGSLYENIVCGGTCTVEQMNQALKVSGFAQDLPSFPMGLNTYISAGGETLSGGQKQRLLLARAFISNPSVLLLDEATSALDNQTQEEVSSYIEELNVTRIVIAQRLKTIRKATKIYVLDGGLIAASGTFEELVAKNTLFADMVARQRL